MARLTAEEKAAKAAEEKRLADEAAKAAEEKRLADEAAKAAEEKRLADEAAKAAEEKRLADEAAKAAEEKRLADEAAKAAEEKQGMTILEAFKLAERQKKVRRVGWSKALDGHFVMIRRGETMPVLSTGKYDSPYTPSIIDVMTSDWEEV